MDRASRLARREISKTPGLTEQFIDENAENLNWFLISMYQKLSEPFIEKYADKIDWLIVSTRQKLSEEFIEKHADKVNWNRIFAYQKLSNKFIKIHTKERRQYLKAKLTRNQKHALRKKASKNMANSYLINMMVNVFIVMQN